MRRRSVDDPDGLAAEIGLRGGRDEGDRRVDHVVARDDAVPPRRIGRQGVNRIAGRRGPERSGQARRRPGRHHDRTEAARLRTAELDTRSTVTSDALDPSSADRERVGRGGELVRRRVVAVRHVPEIDADHARGHAAARRERSIAELVGRPGRDHEAGAALLREREEAGRGEQILERRAVHRRDQRLPVIGCLREGMRVPTARPCTTANRSEHAIERERPIPLLTGA